MKLYDNDGNRIAFLMNQMAISYNKVNHDINCITQYFIIKSFSRIMLVSEKSYLSYCVIWAAYNSGCTICCVNSDVPAASKNEYIEQYVPDIIITDNDITLTNSIGITELFEDAHNNLSRSKNQNNTAPNEVLYVLFTSGSTGVPKGVAILRKAFEEVIAWAQDNIPISENDIVGQYCNIGFDMGLCDVFLSWSIGSTLVPIVGMEKLFPGRIVKKYGITSIYAVPTFVDILEKNKDFETNNLKSIRLLGFGGGALLPKHLEYICKNNPNLYLYNTYGPTETTLFTSCVLFVANTYKKYLKGSICLGKPIDNVQYKIVGNSSKGELAVIGSHCMAGYISEGKKLAMDRAESINYYRTGDIVHFYKGQYYFISRKDNQVKLRGNRIELDGIDARISTIGLEAVSLVIEDKLVIFVSLNDKDDEVIKAVLSEYLPFSCMPDKYIHMEALPLNDNGKYDKKKLVRMYYKELEGSNERDNQIQY